MGPREKIQRHERAEKGLKELKRDIALHQYDVDAGAVADAILNKLRLVREGRRAIDGQPAGRTRPEEQRRRLI